jgi:hypothetical protein
VFKAEYRIKQDPDDVFEVEHYDEEEVAITRESLRNNGYWSRLKDGVEFYWLPEQVVGFDDPISVRITRVEERAS